MLQLLSVVELLLHCTVGQRQLLYFAFYSGFCIYGGSRTPQWAPYSTAGIVSTVDAVLCNVTRTLQQYLYRTMGTCALL